VTRLLSNNLYKSRWIVTNPNSNKRVIDSNDLVIKKMDEERKRVEQKRSFESMNPKNDFEEGLQVKQVGTLFDEFKEGKESESEGVGQDTLIKEQIEIVQAPVQPAYIGPSPEELLETAKQEIELMKTQAEEEIHQMKEKELESAKEIGYAEGKEKAEIEYAEKQKLITQKEKQLIEAYEEQLNKMEIKLVENLTEVYSHVLGVALDDYSPMVLHVLDVAIHDSEDVKCFMVHVSKSEVTMVKDNIEKLRNGLSSQTEIEIIEDVTMSQGKAYIETDGEIFDCSIDTQLSNLSKQIKALAYQK